MSGSVQLKGFAEAEALMKGISEELAFKIQPKALKAAGLVVVKATKYNVPSSRISGSFYRQSKEQQSASPTPLFETIGQRTKTYPSGISVEVVGPQYPLGAHGHLVEKGHKAVYWKKGGSPQGSARVEGKAFLAPAVDSTQSQQNQAMIEATQKGIKAFEKKKRVG